jgi:hypothetical protein
MTTELRLNCDAVDTTPQSIDWREALGENMEGYLVYEASECQGCNRLVVSSSLGENEHRDIEHEVEVIVEGEAEMQRCTCDATIYNEGPAMSYWYPVKIDNPTEAAKLIAHLPLCVVEFEDGRTGLALTGGGMDLSWEICEAFKALGYWPPLHFCNLPKMAGRGTSAKDIELIEACMETCRIAEGWAARKRERLGELRWPAPAPGSVKFKEPAPKAKAKRKAATRKR